jgi:hypothetical protein
MGAALTAASSDAALEVPKRAAKDAESLGFCGGWCAAASQRSARGQHGGWEPSDPCGADAADAPIAAGGCAAGRPSRAAAAVGAARRRRGRRAAAPPEAGPRTRAFLGPAAVATRRRAQRGRRLPRPHQRRTGRARAARRGAARAEAVPRPKRVRAQPQATRRAGARRPTRRVASPRRRSPAAALQAPHGAPSGAWSARARPGTPRPRAVAQQSHRPGQWRRAP